MVWKCLFNQSPSIQAQFSFGEVREAMVKSEKYLDNLVTNKRMVAAILLFDDYKLLIEYFNFL